MLKKNRRAMLVLGAALSLSMIAAACGDDDDDAASETTAASGDTTAPAGDIEGSINISGSSTVEPISTRVAELLEDVQPGIAVTVDGPGTGDGFKLFCAGETDISDASRAIKDEEAQACADAGIEFIEIEVAFDGMAVMTSAENDALECLTNEDLYALIGVESNGFTNWSDAQALATELGSSTVFPDAPLDITAPGKESGTYDAFFELALQKITEARVEEGKITEDDASADTRTDYSAQADDNLIIAGIEGSPSSLGWVGFAFAEEAGDQIKEIAIDGGDGCVAPSIETIADGSYPLSRSLYIYVNKATAEENPALAAYVDFYVGDGISAVAEVGYVDLPAERLAAAQERWTTRTAGKA